MMATVDEATVDEAVAVLGQLGFPRQQRNE